MKNWKNEEMETERMKEKTKKDFKKERILIERISEIDNRINRRNRRK